MALDLQKPLISPGNTEEGTRETPPDAETRELGELCQILESWPEADRRRFVRYLVDRFGS